MPKSKDCIWEADMTQNLKKNLLAVEDLYVNYGSAAALQGTDFTLGEEDILSIVGRNGMGKTTLCNAIMGLVPVSKGSVVFNNQQIENKPPHFIAQMGIGYVPQGRRLWQSLTVDEHIRMFAKDKNAKHHPDSIYQIFPRLAERRHNKGTNLSGGEQQMLAIARALLTNPKLLVMDEPTEGLAPRIVEQIEDLIIRLVTENKISVLIIEQKLDVAVTVSKKVGIMLNGRIERIIPSAQLISDRKLQQELLGVGKKTA